MVLATACGRYGFKDQPAPAPDATPDAAALLQCGQPTRFQVGASSVSALASATRPDGFDLFTVDSSGGLHAWAYMFQGTTLTATAQNAAIGSNANGILGATAAGTNVVVAAGIGTPATGTDVYAIDGAGNVVGLPVAHDGDLAVNSPIASSGGDLALATIPMGGTEVDARQVASDGADASALVAIVDAATKADTVSLVAGNGGYAAVWGQQSSGKHAIAFELLAPDLSVTAGPTIVDDLAYDAYSGAIVWAPVSQRYLVTWHEKDVTNDDDVWFAILDATGATVVAPELIAAHSHDAVSTTDGTSFWMTWDVYATMTMPSYLDGVVIAPDGTTTARPVTSSGGTPGHWTMLARDGQTVLVWTEVGGSGPDLYFDPMCTL